jgi:hypothetical protein
MEKQFVEIKRKHPTLKGVLPIMKKYGLHPKQNVTAYFRQSFSNLFKKR